MLPMPPNLSLVKGNYERIPPEALRTSTSDGVNKIATKALLGMASGSSKSPSPTFHASQCKVDKLFEDSPAFQIT